MSPENGPREAATPRFPRVSGDEPGVAGFDDNDVRFSPRERG